MAALRVSIKVMHACKPTMLSVLIIKPSTFPISNECPHPTLINVKVCNDKKHAKQFK